MVDCTKLDANEAKVLTGTDDLSAAAAILEEWGSRETVISRADGVLVRHQGKDLFAPFTNESIGGRTGRGDTSMGAYTGWRLDYPIEESLRFAVALTSIKMEKDGPFTGRLADVLARIGQRGGEVL